MEHLGCKRRTTRAAIGSSAVDNTYFEQYTAYHLANAPGVGQQTTLTKIEMIK
jgi:hypothetical protein